MEVHASEELAKKSFQHPSAGGGDERPCWQAFQQVTHYQPGSRIRQEKMSGKNAGLFRKVFKVVSPLASE